VAADADVTRPEEAGDDDREQASLERALRLAVAVGPLGDVTPDTRRRIFHASMLCDYAAGAIINGSGPDAVPFGLIVRGRLREFVSGEPERQQTVAYIGAGAVFGSSTLFGRPRLLDMESLTPVRLVRFSLDAFMRLLPGHPDLARAIARQLAHDQHAALAELRGSAFASMRQRVGRHLLMRAEVDGETVQLTQKQLAQAVGTVREVVGRVLAELESDGLVHRESGGFITLDRDRLRAEVGTPPV
jgi:CRP/FNR family transcriptional regulator